MPPRRALRDDHALDERAARNLVAYLAEQREATGTLPTDRQWWWSASATSSATGGSASSRRSAAASTPRGRWPSRRAWRERGAPGRRRSGPTTASPCACPRRTEPPGEELFLLDPDEIDDVLMDALGGSALFAARFRENAARALLLPRRRPGPAHAALDAAPAQLRPAGRGQPLRLVPDHPGDLPRGPAATSSTCRR